MVSSEFFWVSSEVKDIFKNFFQFFCNKQNLKYIKKII